MVNILVAIDILKFSSLLITSSHEKFNINFLKLSTIVAVHINFNSAQYLLNKAHMMVKNFKAHDG